MKYNFLLHLHPRKIKADALKFNLTFGLGGMSALLILILAVTGILLKFHYIPNPVEAYDSILSIQNNLFFGRLVRNLHHWSAIFLIWISFFHLLRVVFTGAFYSHRRRNWYIGLVMLILIILSSFTGYLLAWDQLSYWAIQIITNLIEYIPLAGIPLKEAVLGGESINEQTLLNFYNLHTGLLPISVFLLMLWHFWRVRKAGGVILSQQAKQSEMIDTNPHLIAKEAVVALALFAILVIFSTFFDANLLERANPYSSPNPAKAAWYFMGFQEMLIHFPPFFVVNIIPLLVLSFMIWIPFSSQENSKKGIWFAGEKGKKTVIQLSIITFITTILLIVIEHIISNSLFENNEFPLFLKQISMLFIFTLLNSGLLLYFIKKYKLSSFEKVQLITASLAITYLTFSIVGIFFRGEGMALTFF